MTTVNLFPNLLEGEDTPSTELRADEHNCIIILLTPSCYKPLTMIKEHIECKRCRHCYSPIAFNGSYDFGYQDSEYNFRSVIGCTNGGYIQVSDNDSRCHNFKEEE